MTPVPFQCPGNHISILELTLAAVANMRDEIDRIRSSTTKQASIQNISKPLMQDAVLAELKEVMNNVPPARLHVEESLGALPEPGAHLVQIMIDKDNEGTLAKELEKKTQEGRLDPFPATFPVQHIKVVCADYLVPTVARHPSQCEKPSNLGVGIVELTLNKTDANEDIAGPVLEDAILAEAKEVLEDVSPSRIHVREVRAEHGLGSHIQIVRVHVQNDTDGMLVKKLVKFTQSHVLDPFPVEAPVERAEVVCPEPVPELLHEGGGEERYLSYLKTVCAQLTAGTEMPYPSEGYGQTSQEKMGKGKGVSLSQCVAACNDHSLCTGFSYAKELKQCLLRAGDVQAKAIASIAGVCLWSAYKAEKPMLEPTLAPTVPVEGPGQDVHVYLTPKVMATGEVDHVETLPVGATLPAAEPAIEGVPAVLAIPTAETSPSAAGENIHLYLDPKVMKTGKIDSVETLPAGGAMPADAVPASEAEPAVEPEVHAVLPKPEGLRDLTKNTGQTVHVYLTPKVVSTGLVDRVETLPAGAAVPADAVRASEASLGVPAVTASALSSSSSSSASSPAVVTLPEVAPSSSGDQIYTIKVV